MYFGKTTGQWTRATLTSAWAICLLTPSVLCAQSFNLDFGTSFDGLPSNFGGAAAQTGTWVDIPLGTTNTLVGIDGLATGVTVVANGSGDTFNPQTTLESRLLRDGITADRDLQPLEIEFSGLSDGDYTVYYYSGASGVSGLTINNAAVSDLPGISSADRIGTQGTNWNEVNVTVTGGALSLFSDSDPSQLGGIQIVYQQVPDAPTALTATPADGTAEIAFTAGADNGAAITNYEYSTDGTNYTALNPADTTSPITIPSLTNGTQYSITLRAVNSVGSGAVSDAVSVTPDADSDGDGTLDTDDAFPSDPIEVVDSDGDGIGDNGDAGGTGIGIKVTSASTPASCVFAGAVTQSSGFLDSAPGNPLGIQLNFTLEDCGASVDIEALFGDDLPAGSVAYKVTSAGDWIAIDGATISGNSIRYTVTDGGPLDQDGAVDGRIVDPVTTVVPLAAPSTPVPTLPLYGLLTLGGLLGLFGVRQLKA